MNHSQRSLRSTAAQEFMESLNQLEMRLKTSDSEAADTAPPCVDAQDASMDEEMALAEAVADIEQFMQGQNSEA